MVTSAPVWRAVNRALSPPPIRPLMDRDTRIVIIGTGLLGASLALALKAKREHGEPHAGPIVGVGRRRETLDKARATGGFDEVTDDLPGALGGAGLVVLATPLSTFEGLMGTIAGAGESGLIVSDVGSTKSGPLAAARKHLPERMRFVGAHPMAGSERQGPEAADAGLFEARPCIVCRESDTDDAAAEAVTAMWRSLGMRVLRMTAEAHDRRTAAVSHLPHAAAVMLIEAAEAMGGWGVASTGFRDTTRLASSNPPMRRDIMLENRDALRRALRTLRERIDRLDARLADGDADALLADLEAARARREAWLREGE